MKESAGTITFYINDQLHKRVEFTSLKKLKEETQAFLNAIDRFRITPKAYYDILPAEAEITIKTRTSKDSENSKYYFINKKVNRPISQRRQVNY